METAQFIPRRRQVAAQVNAGGEEVRDQQYTTCAARHAVVAPCRNIGLGELEKTGFNDGVGSLSRQSRGQTMQIVVGRLPPAAMRDQ
jgi:hypothetical protein